jgi:hypothetical protein
MGQTIQFESHTVELWAIYQMEHEEEVLEFYDQPPPFKIQYHNKTGRKIGHYHTPDFFVLRTNGAAWEEWKTETELTPHRYLQRHSSKHPETMGKTVSRSRSSVWLRLCWFTTTGKKSRKSSPQSTKPIKRITR